MGCLLLGIKGDPAQRGMSRKEPAQPPGKSVSWDEEDTS